MKNKGSTSASADLLRVVQHGLGVMLPVLILFTSCSAAENDPHSHSPRSNTLDGNGSRSWISRYGTNGLSLRLPFLKQDQISALTGLQIRQLVIEDGSHLSSFGALALLPLEHLAITNSRIKDLTPLKTKHLRSLVLHGSAITNLAAISQMTSLEVLDISKSDVDTLEPIQNLLLKQLVCSHTHVRDLTPLTNMPLRHLHVVETDVSDLSPLRHVPLLDISLSASNITRGWQELKSVKTLRSINGKEASDFFKLEIPPP